MLHVRVMTEPRYEFAFFLADYRNPFASSRGQLPVDGLGDSYLEVPTFFDGDADSSELVSALARAIEAVYMEATCKPEEVIVGRFTYLELAAFAHRKGFYRAAPGVSDGVMELFGTTIRAVAGPDHFFSATPPLPFLMIHGMPRGAFGIRG